MPLYEWYCLKCKKTYEIMTKISDKDNIIYCDKCRSIMKPKVSRGGFKLKGKGWFKDGY